MDMPEKRIPDGLMEHLIESGLTGPEIVEYFWKHRQTKITRQSVSAWKRRNGYEMHFRLPDDWAPWEVLPEHKDSEPYRVMRLWTRRNHGQELRPEQEDRVARAERFLATAVPGGGVFWYDPDRDGGPWFVVPRRPEDGDSIMAAKREVLPA